MEHKSHQNIKLPAIPWVIDIVVVIILVVNKFMTLKKLKWRPGATSAAVRLTVSMTATKRYGCRLLREDGLACVCSMRRLESVPN